MPIISVVLGQGRSKQQKRDLCRSLTDAAIAALQVLPEQVRVVICETPLDHYAIGGVTFGERAEAPLEEAVK